MNIGLVSLQSNLINYSVRQNIFKPIILLVAGIALGVFSGLLIGTTISRIRKNIRQNHQSNNQYHAFSNQHHSSSIHQQDSAPSNDRGVLRVDACSNRTYCVSPRVRDLELIPCEYVKSLANAIKSSGYSMDFEVNFRNVDGSQGVTTDAGGPTRQFFNLLFQSLKAQFSSIRTKPVDFLSHINKGGTLLLVPQGKPTNNPKTSIFYDIGIVMMYVYFNFRSPLIGPVFHAAFFQAILALDDLEIDTPYDRLSDAAKFKMCKALIQMQQASGESFDGDLDVLKFLEKGDQFQQEDLDNVKLKNFYVIPTLEADSREFLGTEGDEMDLDAVKFDWKAIEKDKKKFFAKIRDGFLRKKTDSLGTIELTLFPIHTMAKAMKALSGEGCWKTIRSANTSTSAESSETIDPQIEAARNLQRKIQGVLDREVLVSKINVSLSQYDRDTKEVVEVVNQQAEWIKTWILDPETTDTLVENLLTFWTGASYIDWEKVEHISICRTNGEGLLPTAATCSRALFVSNRRYSENNERGGPVRRLHNETKEGYYQVLNKIAGEYSSVYTHC